MRKKWFIYGGIGFAFYLVFLLVTFPANMTYSMLEQRLPPQLKLYGVTGSIWGGQAELAVWQGKRIERIKWQLHPASMILGQLSATVSAKQGKHYLQGDIGFSSSSEFSVKDFQASLPISEIKSMLRALPVKLDGSVTLKLDELEVDEGLPREAIGTIVWHSAAVSAPQKVVLGDLKVDLTTTEEGVKAVLSDNGGPLKAEGVLMLKEGGSYQFNGKFAARDKQQKVLEQSLRFLGSPASNGDISVSYSGALPVTAP